MSGTLYVCATPIGNLEDITLRALRILQEADVIVAEDSRRTRALLAHYRIHTPLASSVYQGVEEERVGSLVERLLGGQSVALVSDAGTPLISDPGYPLVRACIEQGIPVVPVPGPSAVLAAIVASGLPIDRFIFLGAVPRKAGARHRLAEALGSLSCTCVLLESPHRILRTLQEFARRYPERPAVLARELTKIHEEFLRGTLAELHAALEARERVRGEFVLLLGPGGGAAPEEPAADVRTLYAGLIEQGRPPREALREAARASGITRREAYQQVHSTVESSH